MHTKKSGGGAGRGDAGWRDQGGCEPRVEVIVKMKKKVGRGVRSGGGGTVGARSGGGVKEELLKLF